MSNETKKLKSYHFNIGGGPNDKIGLCARVVATSDDEAVRRLRAAFDVLNEPGGDGVTKLYDDVYDSNVDRPVPGLEYVRVYLYGENVTTKDIDEVNDYVHTPEESGL